LFKSTGYSSNLIKIKAESHHYNGGSIKNGLDISNRPQSSNRAANRFKSFKNWFVGAAGLSTSKRIDTKPGPQKRIRLCCVIISSILSLKIRSTFLQNKYFFTPNSFRLTLFSRVFCQSTSADARILEQYWPCQRTVLKTGRLLLINSPGNRSPILLLPIGAAGSTA